MTANDAGVRSVLQSITAAIVLEPLAMRDWVTEWQRDETQYNTVELIMMCCCCFVPTGGYRVHLGCLQQR